MPSEDFVSAGLTLASGAPVSLFATTAAYPGRGEAIVLHYRDACAHLAGNLLTIAHHDGREETHGAAAATGSGANPMAFTADWHRDVIADFAAALDDGRPPMIPGRSALAVHALIAAIETSGRTGARAAVPAT
jgi:predicted dehydrogenase